MFDLLSHKMNHNDTKKSRLIHYEANTAMISKS